MATPQDVVAEARRHLGTRWQHQQRLPGVALDCAGLVIVVARALGLVPAGFDVGGYRRAPDGTLELLCDQHLVQTPAIELGGVLLLHVGGQRPRHLGIVGNYVHGGFSLIHASTQDRRVVESGLVFHEAQRLVRAYRLPGVQA